MLEAIIFDVDGTLSETEEAHRRAFNETFAAFGLPWTWDRALYGELLRVPGGKERMRHFMARYDAPGVAAANIEEITIDLHRQKTERYAELIAAGGVPLRPGIERLIGEARDAGVRLAVATTTSASNVTALLLATLGPEGPSLFDAISAGDSVAAKKPAPDVYQAALASLGLAPASCLAIEDSDIGLASAHAADVAVVITPSSYTAHQTFPGALAVVADLDHGSGVLSGGDGRVHLNDLRRLMQQSAPG